jgi:Fic family protein
MKPYIPDLLPLKSLDWESLVPLIAKANRALALYRGMLQAVTNPELFLSPLTTQEAVLSSKMEGTQATLVEVLEYEAKNRPEGEKGDIQEVLNYRTALRVATAELRKRPISLNMVKRLHFVLMDSVRGRDKARGEFRTTQNYIGRPGSTIKEASFVPPPPGRVPEFLANMESYIHYEEKDTLVQLAVVHAQFEIIHPFMDGNGRVGRILIPVFLVEKGLLDGPSFYISAYLEKNRDIYCQRLHDISEKKRWQEWIAFFLTAAIEQANANHHKAISIMAFHDRTKIEVASVLKSPYTLQALDAIFEQPVFNSVAFIQRSGIPERSALRILGKLEDAGVITLREPKSGRKPAVWMFGGLVDLVG